MSPPNHLGDKEKARDERGDNSSIIAMDPTLDNSFLEADSVYQAKARILNDAIQEIGMGRYQVSYLESEPRKTLTIAV